MLFQSHTVEKQQSQDLNSIISGSRVWILLLIYCPELGFLEADPETGILASDLWREFLQEKHTPL